MTIRVFNPEHDLALASGLEHFTAPHAGRHLHSDLSFLPALWSEDGDVVLVDDIDAAETAWQRVRFVNKPMVEFCTMEQLPAVIRDEDIECICPWGWDSAIRFQLLQAGVPEYLLPTKENVADIKYLSSRIHTTSVLEQVRSEIEDKTSGVSCYCQSLDEVRETIARFGDVVVKAPWSSSGRGVRYLPQPSSLNPQPSSLNQNIWNWISNTIRSQRGVMVEPYYNKVKDFGMEFEATREGRVEYKGLSLFETKNGAYTGNLLLSEAEKMQLLIQYLSADLLQTITERLECALTELVGGRYIGVLGVDMMIVGKGSNFLLHPCVEINLRRTMGHVALALFQHLTIPRGTMQVTYEQNKYHLKINRR